MLCINLSISDINPLLKLDELGSNGISWNNSFWKSTKLKIYDLIHVKHSSLSCRDNSNIQNNKTKLAP